MDKKYLREVSFYDAAQMMGLQPDEAYIYSYLSLNAHINLTGLYRIQRRHIIFDVGVSHDRLEGILERLAQLKAIVYDNELMFVPRIPDEQNFLTRKGWATTLDKVRSKYTTLRSELPGAENKAYTSFLAYHAETFTLIDGEDVDGAQDEETPSEPESNPSVDHFDAASANNGNGSPPLAAIAKNGQPLANDGDHHGVIPARGQPVIHHVDMSRQTM